MNAPTPTLYSMLLDHDGKLVLHTPCTAPRCAKQSISPFEGSLVVGLVELYPEKITGIQFWKALQLTQDQPDQVEMAVDVLTQLHAGSAESAAIDGRLAFAAMHRDAVRLFEYFLALHRQEQGFDGPPRIEGIRMPDLSEEADEMVPADTVEMREALVAIAQRLECNCNLESIVDALDELSSRPTMHDMTNAARDGYRDGATHGRGNGLRGIVDRLLRRVRKLDPGDKVSDQVEQSFPHQPQADDLFVAAVRRLVFAGRISGGTAGRDDGLCAALDEVESFLGDAPSTAAPLTLNAALAKLRANGYAESASALERMVKRCDQAQAVTP
ncbi:hypothetical protein [Lysobacter sp. CA199]|uniref:hypothetical protein n=1 Tax=Lysobacter sp. CA199 TaxID=3455608 RepID=UPI003F8D24EE